MKHDRVGKPAKVPDSAVQHWEGNGWQRTDPPPRGPQPPAAVAEAPGEADELPPDAPPLPTEADDETSTESPVDEPTRAKTKTTKAAPSGRKED